MEANGCADSRAGLLAKEPAGPKASARAITINLITSGLGAAIFSLPWSVAGSSVIPAMAIATGVLAVNGFTLSLVVRAAEKYGVFDLGSVVGMMPWRIGRPLKMITNVFVWISQFICLVGYIIMIHDSAYRFLGGTWLGQRAVLVFLASLCSFPLCFLNQQMLEKTSCLAIAVNIYLFFLVFLYYSQAASSDKLPDGCCLLGFSLPGNFSMISVMYQAVVIQMCVLPMYEELEERSPQKFDRILAVSFSALLFLFCGFASAGYLLIGPSVKSNLLEDLPSTFGAELGQLGIIFVALGVYPIMLSPMVAPIRACTEPIAGMSVNSAVSCATSVIVAAVMLTALVVKDLGSVNTFNGAMSSGIFVAVVPCSIGLASLDYKAFGKLALVTLLLVGVAVATCGIIFSDNYVDQLTCFLEV